MPGVGRAGGRRNAASQEALNRAVQFGDIQRSSLLNTSSRSWGGITAGTGDACGFSERNNCRLLRDNASADAFCAPGKCRAVSVMSNTATAKASKRSRCDNARSLAAPLFTTATTAALSQRQQMCLPTKFFFGLSGR